MMPLNQISSSFKCGLYFYFILFGHSATTLQTLNWTELMDELERQRLTVKPAYRDIW